MQLDPRRAPQAVGVFLITAVVMPVLVAGTSLAAILFLPFPAPPFPAPNPTVESRITRITDSAGNEIGLLKKFELSIPVDRSDIPQVLKDAVVAVEDRRFYSHSGVDIRASFRALWADLRGRSVVQGGSTITQQYVKSTYTTGERTFSRKLKEAVLARRLDSKESKDEILFRYLSTIYLGGGAFGVGAAAQSYFHKPVNELTLSESALLAGLITSPTLSEPRGHRAEAEAGRRKALDMMLDQDRITAFQHAAAMRERIVRVGVDPEPQGPATLIYPLEAQTATYPYYVDYVRRYLVAKYGDDKVYRGGLRVETALDPRLQELAQATVADALDGTEPPLDMALATVEPSTGFVKAIVGGRDFDASQVNLALGGCPGNLPPPAPEAAPCLAGGGLGRQAGSAFKPLTLARAFEEGIGSTRVYSGPSRYTYPGCSSGEGCTVANVESGSYGAITLRQATSSSVNTVYAQLIQDVGVKDAAEMSNRLGITGVDPNGFLPSGEPYGPSFTLGVVEVAPLDMAAAFGVFANRGLQASATPVVKVTDFAGNVLEDNTQRKPRRVLSEAVADNMNDVLKTVVTNGTGRAAGIDRPNGTAGKTGTSEDFGDAWFVGYTPQLSAAVWLGYSDSRRTMQNIKGVGKVYGGTIPAQTWQKFMSEALKDTEPIDFAPPTALAGDFAPGARRSPAGIPVTGYQVLVPRPVPLPTIPTVTIPPPLPLPVLPRPTIPTIPTIPRATIPPLFPLPTTPPPTTTPTTQPFPFTPPP